MFFSQSKQNKYLTLLFKIATIVHILCLIAKITIRPHIGIIANIVAYSSCISIICISLVASITIIQFFVQQHQYLILHYKFLGLMIESTIAGSITILLFFNQKITGKFILFIADLSQQAHNNNIIILINLLLLVFSLELYHALEINKKSIEVESIQTKIRFQIIKLLIKLFLIIGTAIGFIHPVLQILKLTQVQEFDSIIFQFTITEFFLYIHTIFIIALGLWLTIGIYYMYKSYRK